MNNPLTYRPYLTDGWFAPYTAFGGMVALLAAGVFIQKGDLMFFPFAAVAIINFWLSKTLYDMSNVVVIFERDGLRIVGGRYKDYRYFSWEDLPYACYAKSFRGNLFLILSPQVICAKEAKSFANRGANSSKICIDSVVVIHMNILQAADQMKNQLTEYVKNVHFYDK